MWILDARLRKKIYLIDSGIAKINAQKDVDIIAKNMNKGYETMINKNHHRYGIEGVFDYNLKPEDKFVVLGNPTSFGNGIVLEKVFVTREQVVDDMAKFYQNKKKNFIANPDELRDRYMVKMYVQENMGQFVWDDKGLFDNVEKGDLVAVSYDKDGILTVGYRIKGESNDPDSKRTMDMGKNKRRDREKGIH
jgi:hypothetical protein